MRHATILVAILAFVPLASATAQEPPPVKVGDRVRVTAPDVRRREGTVRLLTTDSLVLRPEYGAWPVHSARGMPNISARGMPNRLAIPLASVTRLEVSRGQTSRMGPGAGIGLLGGGLLGYLISSGTLGSGCTEGGRGFQLTREACIGVSTVGGAVVGTLLGLVVGAVSKTDRWEEVPLDQLRVNFGPQRDGRFGLGASVRF